MNFNVVRIFSENFKTKALFDQKKPCFEFLIKYK